MKLLIIAALFVATASGSPVSHTLEVGSNGVVGTSAGSVLSPLVSLVINIAKGLGNLVAVEGLPETQEPVHPVIVVDQPALPSPVEVPEVPAVVSPPEIPGVALPELPGGVVVVDPIAPESPIVAPELPESVQVVEPVLPEIPVQVVDPIAPESPIVAPELPESVQVVEPVLPESPVQVVDPIAPESPIVAPELPESVQVVEPVFPESPVQVVDPIDPEVPIVVPDLPGSGVQVVDGENPAPAPAIVPESEDSAHVTNNFLINVLLNFFTGKDGSPSFSSGLPAISSLPPGLQQLFAPHPTPRAA